MIFCIDPSVQIVTKSPKVDWYMWIQIRNPKLLFYKVKKWARLWFFIFSGFYFFPGKYYLNFIKFKETTKKILLHYVSRDCLIFVPFLRKCNFKHSFRYYWLSHSFFNVFFTGIPSRWWKQAGQWKPHGVHSSLTMDDRPACFISWQWLIDFFQLNSVCW